MLCINMFSHGQDVTISDETDLSALALSSCGEPDTLSYSVKNNSAQIVVNSKLTFSFTGIRFKEIIINPRIVLSNGTNPSQPEFSITQMNPGDSTLFQIVVRADCSVPSDQSIIGDINLSYAFNSAPATFFQATSQTMDYQSNVYLPNLVVFQYGSIDNPSAFIGQSFKRRFLVLNSSFNSNLDSIFYIDTLEPGIQLDSLRFGADTNNMKNIVPVIQSVNGFDIISVAVSLDSVIGKNLEFGDNLIIEEAISVIECTDENITSNVAIQFGCENAFCQSELFHPNVVFPTLIGGIEINVSNTLSGCFGSSNSHTQQIQIINTSSTRIDSLHLNVFNSNNEGILSTDALQRIDTSSVQHKLGVNGTYLDSKITDAFSSNTLTNIICSGIEDITNMNISIGELPAGDTLFIEWNDFICCQSTCSPQENNIDRSVISFGVWSFEGNIETGCDVVTPIPIHVAGIQTNIEGLIEDDVPCSIEALDTAQIKFQWIDWMSENISTTASSHFLVSLNHSDKISPLSSTIQFVDHNGLVWPVDFSKSTIGAQSSELYFFFVDAPIGFEMNKATFELDVKGDSCSNQGVAGICVDVILTLDTTCVEVCNTTLFCDTTSLELTCAVCSDGGMQFKDFNLKRTTLGQPDNNNDGLPDVAGTIDTSKLNLKRAIYGDTIASIYTGVVDASGSMPFWKYAYVSTEYSEAGQFIELVNTVLEVWDLDSAVKHTCTALPSNYIDLPDNARQYSYDLSPSNLGLTCPSIDQYRYENGRFSPVYGQL